MKTSKINTTLVALNLVMFISVSSIANPFTGSTGDNTKNQIESVKSTIFEKTSNVSYENDFSNLRFDVNKFNTETEVVELPLNSLDYLRFDVNELISTDDLTEMPVNEFDYLRFDVNELISTYKLTEMPVNDFEYLRFDVNKFSNEEIAEIIEMPVK